MYYSQCQEDLFLNENFFKNKRDGVYIELGALDGVLYSNTKFFQDTLNWTGILIEPHPNKFELLKNNRPNNFLFNNLVSCHEEPLPFRYFVDGHAAVSGVESTLPQQHFDVYFDKYNGVLPQNKIMIKPMTLSEIVKNSNLKHIDLLSLDVEGHEYEVLLSWDFSVPIDLILIETLEAQPEKDELSRNMLLHNNYKFVTKYKHNEIYVLNTSVYAKNIPDGFICSTILCGKEAKMMCPECIKLGIYPSHFCGQDCFKSYWKQHNKVHKYIKKTKNIS
jgi:FkbM family methyltransferase